MAATPLLLALCLTTLLTRGLGQGRSAVLLPVHAREELGGSIDLGLLNAAFGVCALTGALAYGAVGGHFRRWPVFTIAFLVVGLPRFVVAALTDAFAPLAVITTVEGLACGVLNPIMATVTYETVPGNPRSRVPSATTAAVQLVTPLGGLAAGEAGVKARACLHPRTSPSSAAQRILLPTSQPTASQVRLLPEYKPEEHLRISVGALRGRCRRPYRITPARTAGSP
ncbi:MFS transporter [Streptomyces sp. NPDC090231]|uniref:MFS transporter n=1 Tax=unclassified Streptomyces TaxID=2593676 RepID=UPI00381C5B14